MFIHTYITFFFFFSFDLVVLMFFSTTFNYTRTICIEIVYLFIFFEHGLVRVLLLTGEYFYPRGRSYLVVCIVLVSEQSDERIGLTILYACRFFFFVFLSINNFFTRHPAPISECLFQHIFWLHFESDWEHFLIFVLVFLIIVKNRWQTGTKTPLLSFVLLFARLKIIVKRHDVSTELQRMDNFLKHLNYSWALKVFFELFKQNSFGWTETNEHFDRRGSS